MKKLIAVILGLVMTICAVSAVAESAGKATIGTVSINGEFTLQCGLPEGYEPVPGVVTPGLVTAIIRSQDPNAPIMQLSVAFDEKYYDVERMNDLTAEELAQLEETYIEDDPLVEITYGETGYGTLLLVARHESEELDYVAFFSIYEGTTQLQTVAALPHINTGTYSQMLEELEAGEVAAEYESLKARAKAMDAKFNEAIEVVKAANNNEFTDLCSRHLYELAANCGGSEAADPAGPGRAGRPGDRRHPDHRSGDRGGPEPGTG